MPAYRLPYGSKEIAVSLPDGWDVTVLRPGAVPLAADPAAAVEDALDHPLGGVTLNQFRGVRSAAIAISDKTRPVPHHLLLPPLLKRLEALGLPPGCVTLVIANGAHPPMPPEEYAYVIPPEILARHPVVSHDACDQRALVYLGDTARGTPIWVNAFYYAAELKIVLGDIEPHYFVGFSGGVKSAAIGLAGKDTINHNHAMLVRPRAVAGVYAGNPVREDIEEIGGLMGVHFALNALLDEGRRISQVLAGDPVAVMQIGVPLVNGFCCAGVPAPFDLVIASTGGHPKDINLYQAQKSLAHAAAVTAPGGCIILLAACPQGAGSPAYERWMTGMADHEAVLERFAGEGFQVGPHKAFLISRDAHGRHVVLVSQAAPEQVRSWLLEPAATCAEALGLLAPYLPVRPHVAVMPCANITVPQLAQESA